MADDKWPKVREIFDVALRRRPEERPSFVNEACGDDKSLLAEVESLLASHATPEALWKHPPSLKSQLSWKPNRSSKRTKDRNGADLAMAHIYFYYENQPERTFLNSPASRRCSNLQPIAAPCKSMEREYFSPFSLVRFFRSTRNFSIDVLPPEPIADGAIEPVMIECMTIDQTTEQPSTTRPSSQWSFGCDVLVRFSSVFL